MSIEQVESAIREMGIEERQKLLLFQIDSRENAQAFLKSDGGQRADRLHVRDNVHDRSCVTAS